MCSVHTCTNIKPYYIYYKYHLLSVYAHPDWRTGAARAHSQPYTLAGAWTGVVPPQGCLLKAHFTTMMVFPDQTGAWNSDSNGLTANKLLFNFKKKIKNPFFQQLCCRSGADQTWPVTCCCPDDAKNSLKQVKVTPNPQIPMKKAFMRAVEAFPAIFHSVDWHVLWSWAQAVLSTDGMAIGAYF